MIPTNLPVSPPGSPFPAGLVERALGKAPAAWTADDLVEFAGKTGVRLVALMHIGGDGWLKTLDFAPRDAGHLRTILLGGERADGSSLFPGIASDASDVVLRPRLETAFMDPFSPNPTLALLCSHVHASGEPLRVSPDTILRSAYERARRETAMDVWALGEIEFFLGTRVAEERGYGLDDHGYHATSPFVFGEELRRRALVLLGEMGVAVKYGHSEVGEVQTREAGREDWEQHEIELALAPLPAAADAVALAAWTLRNLAHRLGFAISFQPMLREGHPGNGLHVHVSMRREGRPEAVLAEGDSLTESAAWLIGGLVQMGGALMAFGNRVPDSFIRLTQGKEAPSTVTWGRRDRKALIRIPVVAHDAGGNWVSPPTVEFRLPDGSAHQHLLLAGMAQALCLGRKTGDLAALLERTSSRRVRESGTGAVPVPRSPAEVGRELARWRGEIETDGVFPAGVIDRTLAAVS